MAEKQLKSIKFAGLGDTYVLPEIDDSLSTSGMAADAKVTGDAIKELEQKIGALSNLNTTDKTNLVAAINELSTIGGESGTTFTPVVDADGNLSWTNDGGLENPATVNIKGADGYSPVKGTDYFTEEEKAEMVEEVLAALPDGDEVSY